MQESKYDTAQICLNGHEITYSIELNPNLQAQYCDRCGESTINQCPNCNANIRGKYRIPGIVNFNQYHPPLFCHNCSQPFPWTQSHLEAARELADMQDTLTTQERETLKDGIIEIVTDSPKAIVAAKKINLVLAKLGTSTTQLFRDLLVDIASETAKKILFPGM